MPQTRSSKKSASENVFDEEIKPEGNHPQVAGSKRKEPPKEKASKGKRPRKSPEKSEKSEEPSLKAKKQENFSVDREKLNELLRNYGKFPLSDYGLAEPRTATAETILAHLLNAMLTSARISHNLAARSVTTLIEAKYNHLEILQESTWKERTEVLTKGGYTRYREKTATGLGELAHFISSKYDGDLTKLREAAEDDPDKIRDLIKEVKGLGEVGVNIFQDTIQALWPCMAPYIDPRSFDTAEGLGIGKDVDALWEAVDRSPAKMAQLCQALTAVRLEKKEDEFKG